jgi:hypothetical protein
MHLKKNCIKISPLALAMQQQEQEIFLIDGYLIMLLVLYL